MKVTFEMTLEDLPPFGAEVTVDDLAGIKKLAKAIEHSAAQIRKTWPKLAKAKVLNLRIKCEGKAPREAAHKESAAA